MPSSDIIVQAKPWWRSKAFWLGAAHVIGGIAAIPVLGAVIPPKAIPIVAIISGAAQVMIRVATKGPMTTTETKAEAINEQVEQIAVP